MLKKITFLTFFIIISLVSNLSFAEESPVRGFIAEQLKNDKIRLNWTNSNKEKYKHTLIIGSNNEIDWTPVNGTEYDTTQTIDKNKYIITKTTDTEFTTEYITDKKFKYYKAFCFDDDFNYSKGNKSSEKMSLALEITFVGMFVVFIGLILLVIAIKLLGYGIETVSRKRKERLEKRQPKTTIPKPKSDSFQEMPRTTKDEISTETIAVITAAIAATLGDEKKFSIKSIKRREKDPWLVHSRLESLRQQ